MIYIESIRNSPSYAAVHYKDIADELSALRHAVRSFLTYNNSDDEDGVAMMLQYEEALSAAKKAITFSTPDP